MKTIERIKKAARGSVTTDDLFTSRHMLNILVSKLVMICDMFRVACPGLRIIYNPQSQITAATSLDDMIVNAGHPMFDGDDEHRFLKVCGTILHEVGHILFTNYTAWIVWQRDIMAGHFFPHLPDVEPAYEDARSKLIDFATGRYQKAFLDIAHSLCNCLEDGRIENFILKFLRNVRFMMKGLIVLRQETYAECLPFEEIAAKVDAGEANPVGAALQLVIHYARFGGIKGNLDPTHPLGEIIVKMMPEIDKYLSAKEAIVYYDAFNKMLVMMMPLIEEVFNQMQEQPPQRQGQQQSSGQGTGTMSDSGSPSKSTASEPETNDNGKSTDGSDSSGESEQSSSDNADGADSSEQESDESEQEISDEDLAALEQEISDAISQLTGTTVDNSDRMSDKAKGSDRSTVGRRLTGLAPKNSGNGTVKTANAAEAAEGTGKLTHEEASSAESNVGLTLKDITRKITDDRLEQMASEAVRSEYADVASEVKNYSDIHKDADITMYHYPDVTDAEKADYIELVKPMRPLIKKAVNTSNFYEKDRRPVQKKHLYNGTKLDQRSLYKQNGRWFKKTVHPEDPPLLAVAIRVDCSGSMSSCNRMIAAQRCCIFLYEYVLGMEKKYNVKIPLYIYGDCVDRDAYGVNMYVFADDKFRTSNEKYRLMKLAAGGCNRDGLPIRMAVKRLEQEHPQAQKVVFNITDGQPNDSGYGGEAAFDDLRDITRYCEKHRIAIAACAIGSDRAKIEEIYGTSHFLNISDLNELPMRLVKIVKKLLKN